MSGVCHLDWPLALPQILIREIVETTEYGTF